MFLKSFIKFLTRQEKEGKISKVDVKELEKIKGAIFNFEKMTNYFWFIFNSPSKFYKINYAMNKIWRKHMFQKNIKKLELKDISENQIPYYSNPLEILKKLCSGWTNKLLGEYKPEIKWE